MSWTSVREQALFLKPGELVLVTEPMVVSTLLGSCVAVTLYSPRSRVGAICHAVLPACGSTVGCPCPERFRHVDCAIQGMLTALARHGVGMTELEAKIFGGAAMFGSVTASQRSVGQQNVQQAEELLRRHHIPVVARDVGGTRGRKLYFLAATGEVFMKRLSGGAERVAAMAAGGRP